MPIYGSEKDEYGDLIIKFKPTLPDNLTSEQLVRLNELFPKMNEIKELPKEKNHELELATESDFEYSDSEDEDSDDDSEYSDEESDEESDEFEEEEESTIAVS